MNRSIIKIVITLMAAILGCTEANDWARIESYEFMLGHSIDDIQSNARASKVRALQLPDHDPESTVPVTRITVGDYPVTVYIDDSVVSTIEFKEAMFTTREGVRVGQTFCDVESTYKHAELSIEVGDNTHLRLVSREKGLLFDFETGELPLDQYILEGYPEKSSSTFCEARLQSIQMSRFGEGR